LARCIISENVIADLQISLKGLSKLSKEHKHETLARRTTYNAA
jgi:hypothetical protein